MPDDFRANIKVELDESSLQTAQQRIKNIGNDSKIKVGVDAGNSASEINKVNSNIKTAQKSAQSFGTTLKNAMGIGSAAVVVAKGFREIEKAASKAVTAVKDFDAAIADVRTVTGETYDNAAKMVKQYNAIGQALGATTSEVTRSAVTWLRQGKTAEEANTLIRDSTMLAKIGMLDAEDAATYLTSAMNGYKLSVEDAITVVDKLGKLDSSAAVTAGGLAEAMSRTANTANDAGIGIDKLLGYLSVMGEVTQQDMGSIGNSMKTMLARMSNIKAGNLSLIDEDGTVETLSDVETVLNNVGIRLRDSNNEFRNFGDVLDETAGKWDSLSDVQQAALAKAFAGTRQQENFRVLMNNYDKATQYMNIAADSAGTAEQKFGAYLDSIEAKSKSLQAAFESLAVNNISTGLVGGILDATTAVITFVDKTNLLKGSIAGISAVGAIAGIDKLVTGLGNAARKMSTFGDAMRLMKANLDSGIGSHDTTLLRLAQMTSGLSDSQMKAVLSSKALTTQQRLQLLQMQGLSAAEAEAKLQTMGLAAAEGTATTATFSLKSAFTGLWNVLKANPLIAVMAVVTAAVSIYSSYKQKIEETRQAHLEAGQAAREEVDNIKSLYSTYDAAKKAYESNTGSKEDLESATNALLDGLGLEAAQVEELTEKYGGLDEAIRQATIDALKNKLSDLTMGYAAARDALVAKADVVDGWTNGRITTYKNSGDQAVFSDVLKEAGLAYESLTGGYFYGINHGDGVDGIIADYQRLLDMRDALEAGIDDGLYTRTELSSSDVYNKVTGQIDDIKDEYNELFQYINDTNAVAAQVQIDEWKGSNTIPETTGDFAAFKQEMIDTAIASGQFVGSQEDIENAITNTLASMSEFTTVATEYQAAVSTIEDIKSAAMTANDKTRELTQGIGKVQEILGSQTTGKNLSLSDYNSDELQGYTDALEYHNGVLRLNADRVTEIIEAKAAEQKAINDSNKALAQSKYLENAKEIEALRAKIRDKNYAEGESEQSIRNNIAALQAENSMLKTTCQAYDLMNSSLAEATSAYTNWLNAQSASQAGEMFDSSLDAFKKIEDTLFNRDSDDYGRIGNADYKAAIDFVIPDTVDSSDEEAINSYLDSIDKYFTRDNNGGRHGLNISKFCEDAVAAGLMVLDENGENYVVAGQKTMEDFAEGLGLSLPLVQAMFGEMEEFGAVWDFSDEAVKTLGDLAMQANESAEALRNIAGNEDLEIRLNVDDITDKAEAIKTLDDTIQQMDDLKIGADAAELEYANDIIQYCIEQKRQLETPLVMNVDTSLVQGQVGDALSLIQQFVDAKAVLDSQIELNAHGFDIDTSAAQSKVDSLAQEIQSLPPAVINELEINTDSISSIQESISSTTFEAKLKFNYSDALLGYTPEGDQSINVTTNLDTSAVDAFMNTNLNRSATVTYGLNASRVSSYNPANLTRTVTYYVRTVGSADTSSSAKGGTTSSTKNGTTATAKVMGTAYAGGNWRDTSGGKTLVGELGREIVVDPHTGKWYTVGDNGAEFVNIPRGGIVFNHLQTEDLLRDGNTLGRALSLANGTALARGNAMVTGGISAGQADKSTTSGGASTSSSSSSSSSSKVNVASSASKASQSADDTASAVDWITVAIDRLERAINRLGTTATSAYKSLKTRLGATYDEMQLVSQEMEVQYAAMERYMQAANEVGLPADLQELVKNGAIDIGKYDEETQDLINEFQTMYEAALDCSDAIQDLHENLAKLYSDNFNNIAEDYENQLELLEHLTNTFNTGIDMLAAKGYMQSTDYYAALGEVEKQNIILLEEELTTLTHSLSEAMNSGEIEEFSSEWYEMQKTINDVKEAIDEAHLSLAEYAKTMREIEWGYFDYYQGRIAQLTQESNFLIDLLDNNDLYTDRGQLTNEGQAAMGLHGLNYNVYMAQADMYAAEMQKINKELAEDPYNTDLIARREELLALQQQSIQAAEQEKQAIVDMVKNGIDLELDSLKDLINTYTDSLSAVKDLYDYQKKVRDQTSEISSLQKQLRAYTGDNSEEAKARIQKIQVELKKAQEDLEETEYDKYISDQKKLLGDLYDEYEYVLNRRLDDINFLIEDMINQTNLNAGEINSTLWEVSESVGYTMSDNMTVIWGTATEAMRGYLEEHGLSLQDAINQGLIVLDGTLSMYGQGFLDRMTATNAVLGTVDVDLNNLATVTGDKLGEIGTGFTAMGDKLSSLGSSITPYLQSIKDLVSGLVSAANAKAQETITSPSTTPSTAADPSVTPPTQANTPSPSTPPTPSTPSTPAATEKPALKVGSYVNLKSGTKWYYSSDGAKPTGDADSWLKGRKAKISIINSASWATHPYCIENYGWVKKTDIVGYATGGLVNSTGPAWLDGTPRRPEIVLNPSDSQNFIALRDSLAQMAKRGVDLSTTPKVQDIGNMVSNLQDPANNVNNVSVGDTSIQIDIDHVQDYADFVNQMVKDQQFEQFIQSITIDRIYGGSAMSKNKYRWK